MNRSMIAAVLICAAGASPAGSVELGAIANDSSASASSADLGKARELSSRLLDGGLVSAGSEPVSIGDITPAAREDIRYSETKRVSLRAAVPGMRESAGGEKTSSGFLHHMKEALTAPVAVPYARMTEAGLGSSYASAMKGHGTARVVFDAVIGGLGGLLLGMLMAPVIMVKNIGAGIASLFKD